MNLVWPIIVLATACGARSELEAPSIADACASSPVVDLQIPATVPWTDTGIDLVAGTSLVIMATGTVRYGPMPSQVTDANGGNYDGRQFFGDSVLPNAVTVSLIGKIGGTDAVGTGTPLPSSSSATGAGFVGTSYEEAVPASGRLFLGFNDQVGWFFDNSGSFSVAVSTRCSMGM